MSWLITADWENLDEGSPEERAAFAAVGIKAYESWLTEGNDSLVNRLRQSPLLSAYHLAEWFAWNWWRLRWEPRSHSPDWAFSHRMSTIGSGYIWPDITIFSDGERTALVSRSTPERQSTPFRYINDSISVIPAGQFERGLDTFLEQVIDRLESAGVTDTNLHSIWASVLGERADPSLARLRKLEALLGVDPDSAQSALDVLNADAAKVGEAAVEELAAEFGQTGKLHSQDELRGLAQVKGFDADPAKVIDLRTDLVPIFSGATPAARVGQEVARSVRSTLRLGEDVLTNDTLANIAGVDARALERRNSSESEVSFAIDESANKGRVVLRSKWDTGRRFELARLLGDRLMTRGQKLFLATRSYTYRQKAQRAFAAEFLSPWETVLQMLDGDYSSESQQDVAGHFTVSPLTIHTMLVNRGRIAKEDFGADFDIAAA